MQKPELLAPVGNVESFYAAIKAGADAIYMGLKQFNARERAANFTSYQFLQAITEAHKANVKVYVTLNTIIKNNEIGELIETLWFLSKANVDAIIVQDWGTFFLVRQFFPKLTQHASTQMANHNSLGAIFSRKIGFSRIILARELTLPELDEIQKKSVIETEIFVHGALCYSFSGMCLFSSYLGGAGANRGLCAQPCRRFYQVNESEKLVFSMKDNQQIDLIPKFIEMGIKSLKIEGRLKSSEYVFKVVKAYRMVIDNQDSLSEAKQILKTDFGREKTQWFLNKQLQSPISSFAGTGEPIGNVISNIKNLVTIRSSVPLKSGNRIRIRTQNDNEPVTITLNHFVEHNSFTYQLKTDHSAIQPGDEVMLIGSGGYHFSSKLKSEPVRIEQKIASNFKNEIFAKLKVPNVVHKESIYLRINNLDWLPFISFDYINHLIIQLTKKEFQQLGQKEIQLTIPPQFVWFELPQFIPEKDIQFYKDIFVMMNEMGYKRFSLSHLSQKELLPEGSFYGTNENVYCFNDATARFLKSENADWITSPFENEMENLFQGTCKNILIPVYYYPRLFYSRQPIASGSQNFHDAGNQYRVFIRNGITEVVPAIPVALMQYKPKLLKNGFNQFLIDLSFEEPSKTTLKRIVSKLKHSESAQPSTTFNFKKGLH